MSKVFNVIKVWVTTGSTAIVVDWVLYSRRLAMVFLSLCLLSIGYSRQYFFTHCILFNFYFKTIKQPKSLTKESVLTAVRNSRQSWPSAWPPWPWRDLDINDDTGEIYHCIVWPFVGPHRTKYGTRWSSFHHTVHCRGMQWVAIYPSMKTNGWITGK